MRTRHSRGRTSSVPGESLQDLYRALDAGPPPATGRRKLLSSRWRRVLPVALVVAAFVAGIALDATVLRLGEHGHPTGVVIGQKVIREAPPRTVPRPQPPGTAPPLAWGTPVAVDPGASLRSVSCANSAFCAAVDDSGGTVLFVAGRWTARQRIDGTNQLNAVSCTSQSWCMAVDQVGNAMTYDGVRWSTPQRIDSAGFPELTAVSCAGPSFCAAVDGRGNGLIYDGSRWSTPEPVDPPGWSPISRDVPSVSCPSVGSCVGVDPEGNAFFYQGGTWQLAAAIDPSLGAPAIKTINSVACATATFCVATSNMGSIDAYDGTQWSLPVAVDSGNYLSSISCPAVSFCAAIDSLLPAGFDSGGGSGQVVTYNGITWSAPRQVDDAALVSSISCPSPQFCAAVDGTGRAVIGRSGISGG